MEIGFLMAKHGQVKWLGLAALIAVVGCGPTSGSTEGEEALTGTASDRLEVFTRRGWLFDLGETKAAIIENLGRPTRVDTQVVANRHRPEVQDTIYTLIYDGLEARIYDATSSDKEILTNLTLTHPRYEMRWNLGVGTSAQRVIRVLGRPNQRSENKLEYRAGEPAEDHLTFSLEGNSVQKIDWGFYVD